MDYKLLVVALLVVAVAISAFLEWVKLTAKKQKKEIPTFVLIIVPAMLSIGLSWVVWSALDLPGKVQIIALYSLVVFLAQYYLSMEILKRIGTPIAKFFMRSKGMTDEEIKEVLDE